MEKLYTVIDELLSSEEKMRSLQKVFEKLKKVEDENENIDTKSVIVVSLDSLQGIGSKLHEGISVLDSFIADNAGKYRSDEPKTQ